MICITTAPASGAPTRISRVVEAWFPAHGGAHARQSTKLEIHRIHNRLIRSKEWEADIET